MTFSQNKTKIKTTTSETKEKYQNQQISSSFTRSVVRETFAPCSERGKPKIYKKLNKLV